MQFHKSYVMCIWMDSQPTIESRLPLLIDAVESVMMGYRMAFKFGDKWPFGRNGLAQCSQQACRSEHGMDF